MAQLITPGLVGQYLIGAGWTLDLNDPIARATGGQRYRRDTWTIYMTAAFTTSAFIRDLVQKIAVFEKRDFLRVYHDVERLGGAVTTSAPAG